MKTRQRLGDVTTGSADSHPGLEETRNTLSPGDFGGSKTLPAP